MGSDTTCATCIYYGGTHDSRCHYRPPVLVSFPRYIGAAVVTGLFEQPRVSSSDWCGDWVGPRETPRPLTREEYIRWAATHGARE